jgi:hypothetical protein
MVDERGNSGWKRDCFENLAIYYGNGGLKMRIGYTFGE